MPTSHPNQINEIIQVAELLRPTSVLDVGVGYGKYGFLLREYLDANQRGKRADHKVTIDGIEGTAAYITDMQRAIYDTLYIGDAGEQLALLEQRYDLAVAIDFIEHFHRAAGMALLGQLMEKSRWVLVATPWNIGDPDFRHDNPLEDHKYQWRKKDFSAFPHHVFLYNHNSLMVLLGQDRETLLAVEKKMNNRFYKMLFDRVRRRLGIKKC